MLHAQSTIPEFQNPKGKSVAFAVGSGRCGTQFLADVFGLDSQVASCHERHAFSDTFHRYCRWYDIPVDDMGFLKTKEADIVNDLANRKVRAAFEASAYLSLSLETLHRHFGARFILMIRRPEKVILSYLRKGWYRDAINIGNPDLPPSGQACRSFHHFMGRTLPRGDEYKRWERLTQVGKLAWFWNRINREVLGQFESLPGECVRVQKLEELDYPAFVEISKFIGVPQTNVSLRQFSQMSEGRPNSSRIRTTVQEWSPQERREFAAEAGETAARMGYSLEVF
jgi:hypothetical protein